MKNQLLINDLNKDQKEVKKIFTLISKLKKARDIVESTSEQILLLEKQIEEEVNYQAIGIKEFNLRVSITKSKIKNEVNVEKTIEKNSIDKEKYTTTKKVVDIKTIFDKEQMLIDYKDHLVYEEKESKQVIKFTVLEKSKEE